MIYYILLSQGSVASDYKITCETYCKWDSTELYQYYTVSPASVDLRKPIFKIPWIIRYLETKYLL